MKKSKIEECISLTDDVLTEYYSGRLDSLYRYLHKDCMWIGEMSSEYLVGKTTVLDALEKKKEESPRIVLTKKEFQCGSQDRNSCVIVGRYIGNTERNSDVLICDMQRVTFIWKEDKGTLYLMHMHVSNPFAQVENDELFPNTLGKQTKNYLDMLIYKEVQKEGYITIKDHENRYHKLHVSNIVYVEAFNIDSLVHTTDGDIFAKVRIVDLERMLVEKQTNMFMRVHKSYLINKCYVTSIKHYEVTLANEFTVPVPKEKYQKVREALQF